MTPTLLAAGRMLASARTRAALSLGVVLAVGATGTFAYWTDSVPVTGTSFTAGTIDLKVNNLDTVSGYTSLNLSTMVPGNSTAAVVTIKNNGTAPLKWTATSNGTNNALTTALSVKVTGDASVTGTSPSATCTGTALTGAASTLGAGTDAGLVSTGRQLAASASETVCIQVTLPSTNTNTALMGVTNTINFTFTGTSDLS